MSIIIDQISPEHMWINDLLVELAKKERAETPGCSLGVMSGSAWASLKMTAGQWNHGAVKRLDEIIQCAVLDKQFFRNGYSSVEYWFTGMDDGATIDWHDHSDAIWTGVYYPQNCPGLFGGQLEFELMKHRVLPYAGMLIQFDPSLRHRVLQVDAQETRWSMAFNVMR